MLTPPSLPPQVVLTAGHCVYDSDGEYWSDTVRVGSANLKTDKGEVFGVLDVSFPASSGCLVYLVLQLFSGISW